MVLGYVVQIPVGDDDGYLSRFDGSCILLYPFKQGVPVKLCFPEPHIRTHDLLRNLPRLRRHLNLVTSVYALDNPVVFYNDVSVFVAYNLVVVGFGFHLYPYID